mmetsp:Transcript_47141/g.156251  ORF Transcript_47141/g.156251 Transcript_47141/m.156251 type:complete len:236 (-) Transcript_47141:1044-1751(-)
MRAYCGESRIPKLCASACSRTPSARDSFPCRESTRAWSNDAATYEGSAATQYEQVRLAASKSPSRNLACARSICPSSNPGTFLVTSSRSRVAFARAFDATDPLSSTSGSEGQWRMNSRAISRRRSGQSWVRYRSPGAASRTACICSSNASSSRERACAVPPQPRASRASQSAISGVRSSMVAETNSSCCSASSVWPSRMRHFIWCSTTSVDAASRVLACLSVWCASRRLPESICW